MKSTLRLFFTLFFIGFLTASYGQRILAEKHFESDNAKSVKVIGIFCDVNVVQRDQLIFDGLIKGDGDEGDYVIAVIQSGSEIVFKVERKKDRNWGWNDMDIAKLDLQLPAGVELSIENTSGDILIDEYSSSYLDVSATSGDITLKQINANIQARTTSGDVLLRDVTGNIAMRSTSGNQEFFGITGDVKTVATSGDIEIDRMVGDLDMSTTSGDMDVDSLEGMIQATATSGDIEGNYVLLTGDSRFKSTSGNIYVELENDLEKVGFDLRATSGDLEVGRIDGDDHLVIRRGDISITGISTSGDQRDTN